MADSKLAVTKEIVHEARRVIAEEGPEIGAWLEGRYKGTYSMGGEPIASFSTPKGDLHAVVGDWLVRSRTGKIHIYDNEEFEELFSIWTPPTEKPKEPAPPVVDALGNDLTNMSTGDNFRRITDNLRRTGTYGVHPLDD